MATNRTFTMIKPEAVENRNIGAILERINAAGFTIVAMKKTLLSAEKAGEFYYMHKDRPFYPELVKFMTSGPCVPFVIKGENAILKVRELMGATDPSEADAGTIRADFADSIDKNIIHGSDSKESAEREVSFFFD